MSTEGNRALWTAGAAGVVFALGLGLAGMTDPSRVLGFLDVTGAWDPRLAGVMGGAVLVGLVGFGRVLRRPRPVLDPRFHLPSRRTIDARLLVGAVLFGTGWALAGYCPGPAIVSLASGSAGAWIFVAAMLAGVGLAHLWERRAAANEAGRESIVDLTPPR